MNWLPHGSKSCVLPSTNGRPGEANAPSPSRVVVVILRPCRRFILSLASPREEGVTICLGQISSSIWRDALAVWGMVQRAKTVTCPSTSTRIVAPPCNRAPLALQVQRRAKASGWQLVHYRRPVMRTGTSQVDETNYVKLASGCETNGAPLLDGIRGITRRVGTLDGRRELDESSCLGMADEAVRLCPMTRILYDISSQYGCREIGCFGEVASEKHGNGETSTVELPLFTRKTSCRRLQTRSHRRDHGESTDMI